MTILLCDPRVHAVTLLDSGEPLVRLDPRLGDDVLLRAGLAWRVVLADALLPEGVHLWVVEGHRSARSQQAIIDDYTAVVRRANPDADDAEVRRLTSRFVAPLEVAPHVAGAAIDVTLRDGTGRELDLGTPVDATPEESDGACYLDAPDIGATARAHRRVLAAALSEAGLVNYPTEWWHWSFGDRYWALLTGAPHALHGPVEPLVAA